MKRTRLRQKSAKRRKREGDCADFRKELIERVWKCEACLYVPDAPHPMGWQMGVLVAHEILNAGFRQSTLDEPCSLLVACVFCNQYELHNRTKWPRARQLAALLRSRPEDYDLPRFLELWKRGPRAITQEEVDHYLEDWA